MSTEAAQHTKQPACRDVPPVARKTANTLYLFGCVPNLIKGEQLKTLAEDRLKEAKLLYGNGYYQGAYYIAGYAVEVALKALICKRLGVEVFVGGPGMSEVTRALQTHHLPTLLIFAVLFTDLQKEKDTNESLFKDWSKVAEWSEQRRYEPLACSQQTVLSFINASEHVMQWIVKHYSTR